MSNPTDQKPGFLSSILAARCPRCRRGPIFKHKAYDWRRFLVMYRDCPVCGQHYEIEPGFFWGAMYISYAFSTALFIGWFVIWAVTDLPIWQILVGLVVSNILLLPLSNRYSRVLLLYLFASIKYDPQAAQNPLQKQEETSAEN